MKKFFWKYAPLIIGLLMGFLIINPPEFLRTIGWQGYLVLPVLFLLLLFTFFPGYVFVRSVHRKFELIPLEKQTNRRDINILMDELNSLGFVQAGPALDLPGFVAIIVPFVHEDAEVYCTIIRSYAGVGKTTFAFSSIFDDDSGGLTTFREHLSAMEPRPAGSFRQVFQVGDLKSNFQHHLKGLEYLQKYGLNTRQINSETFVDDETKAVMGRNKFLQSNLVRNTIIYVWRFLIRRTPYGGPIEKQKDAQKSLRLRNREPVSGTDTKTDLRRKIIADIEMMRGQIPTIQRHSGLGIASFIISMFIIGFSFFLFFLAAVIGVIAPDSAELSCMITRIIAAFFMFAFLANLVGLGLGLAAIRQIGSKKVYPILGLVFNFMIFAGMIVLIIIGRLIS
jgi:hypothetical protein